MKRNLELILKHWKSKRAYIDDREGNTALGKIIGGEWKIVVQNKKQVVKLELEVEEDSEVNKILFDVNSIRIREVDSENNII